MADAATRVLVSGALGRMGERVRAALQESPGLRLAAALEAPGSPGVGSVVQGDVRIGDDPGPALDACDVLIDFTAPGASLGLVRAAAERGVACVVGTTGFDAAQQAELEALARRVALLRAPNFSVAVNVLFHLVEEAARLLGPGFDAEIVELHHAAKRDAPSGTALRLAEAVAAARGVTLDERGVFTRHGETGPRPAGAIGVQTLRGGDNPGEHTALFLGTGERLELAHRSATRDHFARGAVRAAAWLAGRPAGAYHMRQVLGLEGGDGGG